MMVRFTGTGGLVECNFVIARVVGQNEIGHGVCSSAGRSGAVGFHCCLRATESPCNEILKEPSNPCSARPTEIARATSILNVLNCHRESRRQRMTRMLARHPFDLESKIGGGKSKVNDFRCKRELVATANQVMVGIATK